MNRRGTLDHNKWVPSSWYSMSFLTLCCVFAASSTVKCTKSEVRTFPEWFEFGTATAAYQVEGAWDEDGKSESIWDVVSHREPCLIAECHTGDIAADSYHHVERDVEMMRELGLDYYRFSISWTRILPTSFPDKINDAGVQYYNNLINEMLKYNIQPMVTLYHWDLPQKLQEMGGWTNPYVIDWFADYARICFELFGDRVKKWITINEPAEVCRLGYGIARLAPLLPYDGAADYMCTKNVLLAHAKAYHIYDAEFRPKYSGEVAISIESFWLEPASDSEDDIAAAETERQFRLGLYANPIYSGDFPAVVKERVAARSFEQGFPRSRLPELTSEEVEYIKGTSDFFGLNHYTTYLATRNSSVEGYHPSPSMYDDMGVISYQPEEWENTAKSVIKVIPWGFYKLLTNIRERYNNPPVYVTENGFPSTGGLEDDDRISYFIQYLNALLDAVEDGSNIRGYTAWSLMDNFEWTAGFTERFGLYEVDYSAANRTRTARKSAFFYKQTVSTRQLASGYESAPDRVITIDDGD